ncbi:prepilin-type N-terminal cleavage/methylation domain-containing protein [Acetobacteraceae bacterium]|nr:prepilin-type N-terminal cleavage/methylation domain-containing protein [Candidatus Parcubacteria bacterium]
MPKLVSGFTLIELLVVIAIIGILAGIVLASLGGARTGGKDAKRISEVRQIQYALELYYGRYATYPSCLYSGTPAGCTGNAALSSAVGGMPSVPTGYTYASRGSAAACNSYHLGISLEVASNQVLKGDKDSAVTTLCNANSPADFEGTSAVAAGAPCNATAGVAQGQPSPTETCYDVTP